MTFHVGMIIWLIEYELILILSACDFSEIAANPTQMPKNC